MAGSIVGSVAGAVAGKALGGIFGGDEQQAAGGGSGFQQIHQTSEVLIPDYLKDIIHGSDDSIVSRANEFSLRPYSPFTGTRIAGFNPDQLQAFQGVRDVLGQYLPQYQGALDITGMVADRASEGFVSPDSIAQYMSPYQQQVTDIAKREAIRDFDKQLNQVGDVAAQAGAFGGDRHGIIEAEAYRDLGQRLDDLQVQGLQSSYDRATDLALRTGLAETQTLGQAAAQQASLAGAAQGYTFNDLAALQQVGGQQQALNQSLADFNYGQFIEEREYPYQQLSQLSSLVYPLLGQSGSSTQNTNTQAFNPGLSSTNAALGGAAIGQSIFGGNGFNFGQNLGSLFSSSPVGPYQPTGGIFGGIFDSLFKEGGLVPYVDGYKEGGKVKKAGDHSYADGGPVDSLTSFLRGLESLKYSPREGDSRLDRIGGGLSNAAMEYGFLPLRVTHGMGVAGQSLVDYLNADPDAERREKEAKRLAREAEENALKEGKSKAEAMKERHEIENLILAIERPEEFGHLNPALTPEEKQAIALKDKINNIATDLGAAPIFETSKTSSKTQGSSEGSPNATKSVNTGLPAVIPPKTSSDTSKRQPGRNIDNSILSKANLPLLAMGARILQTPGQNPLTALGMGLDTYIGETQKESAGKAAASQQQFENLISQLNANTNRMNAEVGARRVAFEEELLPLEKGKLQASISKMNAEAQALGDPVAQEAAKMTSKQIQDAPHTYRPEDIPELYRNNFLNIQKIKEAQGFSDKTSLGDPLNIRR